MKKNYTIVTGYHDAAGTQKNSIPRLQFYHAWYSNTVRYSDPCCIFVVNVSGKELPRLPNVEMVNTRANLGHVLNDTGSAIQFCGWHLSILTGMMVAYNNRSDFIYKEQDCLAVGPWVDLLYEEMREKGKSMLYGRGISDGWVEQSLFVCRFEYIPKFVNFLTGIQQRDAEMLPEIKHWNILMRDPDNIGYFSMGYGRQRNPAMWNDRQFYIQQPTNEEVDRVMSR